MPINAGLLGLQGIAEGIKSGINTYRDERKFYDEKKRHDAELGLLANKQGFDYNPEGGGLVQNELGLAENQSKLAQTQLAGTKATREMGDISEENDPNSRTTQRARAAGALFGRALSQSPTYKNSPELENIQEVFQNGSARDINQVLTNPAVSDALKESMSNDKFQAMMRTLSSKQDTKGLQEATGTFNAVRKDKEWQHADGMLQEAENLRKLTQDATTNSKSADALGVFAARYATGGQRLNQMEINALGGKTGGIASRLAQIVEQAKSGTLRPENAAWMNRFIDVTSQSAQDNRDNIEDAYAGAYHRTHSKMVKDPDEASGLIFGTPTHKTLKGLMPAAPPQAPQGTQINSADDAAMLSWAQKNPNSPRAKLIFQELGTPNAK